MNILEFLIFLKKRPLMYLDNKSIQQLYDFIGGFLVAKHVNNLLDEYDEIFSNDFYSFVKEELNIEDKTNWKDIILEHWKHDDEKAFDFFFKLLGDFKNIKIN